MSISHFPLDIVPSILDELAREPSPKPQAMQALRTCSLTCRAWRPIAQQRLLKNISLVEPAIQSLTKSKHNRARPSTKRLLDTIRGCPHWLTYVHVLNIKGLISDPELPEILETFAKVGELRSFLWEMPCSAARSCIHWYNYPKVLRSSVKAVLSSPKLRSIELQSICGQFPMEILGYSPLKHLKISGSVGFIKAPTPPQENGRLERTVTPRREPAVAKAQVESLNLEGGPSYIVEHYKHRQDFHLDFSQLKELSVMHVQCSVTQSILNTAAESLTHFSANYWSEWEDGYFDPEELRDDYLDITFQNLSSLRVLSIRICHFADNSGNFYNHLLAIAQILEHAKLPNTVETLNLAISPPLSTGLSDDLLPGRLPSHIEQAACDSKLAELCLNAKSRGHFREINLRFLISGWTKAMDYFLRNGAERYDVATAFDGEPGIPTVLQEEEALGKVVRESGDSEIEKSLRLCYDPSNDANRSDILRRYPSFKNLPRRLENTFPLLQSTGMFHLEVLDREEYDLCQSSREIW